MENASYLKIFFLEMLLGNSCQTHLKNFYIDTINAMLQYVIALKVENIQVLMRE